MTTDIVSLVDVDRGLVSRRWCCEHGFRFSPRLHILLWGPKRGV